MISEDKILSVTQYNTVVQTILEHDELLAGVTVRGEISNFKAYPSGHFYFTLKDEGSALACVMFSYNNRSLRFRPENGMQVRVRGRGTVYVKDGRYQFVVTAMEPDGVGGLYAAYEKLKEKLEKEGLFDPSHKKELPAYPRRVGVITSGAGAAFRDILNVTERRFPSAQILLYPAFVQGEEAPASLIAGVRRFSEKKDVDVLIIGRGGGSIEDLWAFNNEALARALYACPLPTISAVGHETDFTICDFVCDKRAPTPSAAAELAVPDRTALLQELSHFEKRIQSISERAVADKKERLRLLSGSAALRDRMTPIKAKKDALTVLEGRCSRGARMQIERKRALFTAIGGKMASLNPMAVLGRGYGAVFNEEGRAVGSASVLKVSDRLTLRFRDGAANVTVDSISLEKEREE